MQRVVIVGASLAGLATARSLRHAGFEGAITVVDRSDRLPVDRPPLTKQVLVGEWTLDRATQPMASMLGDLQLDLRLGFRAIGFDLETRVLRLASGDRSGATTGAAPPDQGMAGEELRADGLVVASGALPRPMPRSWQELVGLHTIRDHDDVSSLLADLGADGGPVLVVGAGVIGLEAAASLRTAGRQVTVVEPQPLPMMRVVPEAMGQRLAEMHREHGVDLRLGVGVERFLTAEGGAAGRVVGAELSDHSTVEASIVIVGIGVAPSSGWLVDSEVPLDADGGVLCDATCQAAPGVWAAGDIASYMNRRYDERMRVEHWDHALEMGEYLGRRILNDTPEDFAPVPYFWTDQFQSKLQVAGRYHPGDEAVVIEGDPSEQRCVLGIRHGDRLGAVIGMNRPAAVIRWRTKMATGNGVLWNELLDSVGNS